MLLNRANLEIGALCSDDDMRFNLGGVYVGPEGQTVATNGHYLGVVSACPLPAEEFPSGSGYYPSDEPLKGFIMPKQAAAAIAKALPKRSTVPILSAAAIDVAHTNVNGEIRVHAVGPGRDMPGASHYDKILGEFPDYTQVLPKGEPAATIGLNVDYLEKICRTMKRCGVTGGVKLEIMARDGLPDDCSPVRISAKNDQGQEITVVLMPCRL